eukprot:scaffold15649_cov57-Phaeocystis_antarctica.AAC.2
MPICRPEARSERERRPSVSARRARSPPPQAPPRAGGMGHTRRCYAHRARAHAHGRSGRGTSGQTARRPDASTTPQRASAVSHAGSLTGSSRTGWPDAEGQAGGKAEASTNGREAATSVWQADVSAGTRRARRTGQCCSPCRRCLRRSPIGGVSSSERVPRVRRRGEAAPLGRAWLEWGSCLETRASGAPAVPPDPKVDEGARASYTQRSPQRPGSSPTANLTCHAARDDPPTKGILSARGGTQTRPIFLKPSLRLHTRLKLAEALPTTPMSIVQRPTCLDLATLPCHGTHQTGMPLVRGELPEHTGRDHTSTPCTLSIAPVQSEGTRASKATVNRLRPPSTIGCSALPC